MAKLKHCPFCGEEALVKPNLPTYGSDVMYYAVCANCRMRTPLKWTEEEAIEAWNRMAEDGK